MKEKIQHRNHKLVFLIVIFACFPLLKSNAQSFVEEFDTVGLLWSHGWDSLNISTIWGDVPWKQPPSCLPVYSGNGNITTGCWVVGDTGIINVWLIAPTRILQNGDLIHFYTHSCDSLVTTTDFPDRLQVRYSTNGGSANVGTSDTSVGDFTNLLLDINPNYYSPLQTGTYPGSWHHYVLTISGLNGPTPGRFAFRYFVEHAHSVNFSPAIAPWTNASAIGIDSLAYVSVDDKGVGINEINEQIKLIVNANRSGDIFQFIYSDTDDKIQQIDIYNLAGEKILNTRGDEINLIDFYQRIYFYSVHTRKGKILSGKIFKE